MSAFLEVDDPKQSKINKLIVAVIASWIGLGTIVNISGHLWYYFVTLPNTDQSSILQTGDIGMNVETLLLTGFGSFSALMITAFGKLWTAYRDKVKELIDLLEKKVVSDGVMAKTIELQRIAAEEMFDSAKRMHDEGIEAIRQNNAKIDTLNRDVAAFRSAMKV